MRFTYTLLLYLTTPLMLLRLSWLGFRNPGYWQRWPERLGFVRCLPSGEYRLWLHAVSVGEVQAAMPLVKALQARYPGLKTIITTTTPTGADCVRQQLAGQAVHFYMPYDLPGAVRRFLHRVKPSMAIVMETELWPNMLHLCKQFGVPVILANARLSERSMRGYQRLRQITQEMLAKLAVIAAQTLEDANRFIALGADPIKVSVTGNIKFEVALPPRIWEQAKALKQSLGVIRPIWMAASTHEAEEAMVLEAFEKLLKAFPAALLLLAPRHPERSSRVFELCQKRGLRSARRSEKQHCNPEIQVFLIDTMGELPLFYAVSNVAFVGGSLVRMGGHNPLEPASVGIPVVTGPHVFNFKEIFRLLTEAGAATMVWDTGELAASVSELLADSDRRRAAGARGSQVVEANRGAVDRVMELLTPYLP